MTGKSLDDAYRRYLYEPLGLRSTYRRFIESPPAGTRTAEAHVFQGEIDFTQVPALTADWAGGGLNSTVDDLNRFLRAIARNEVFRDSSTREMMFQWMPWSGNAFYGLGVIRFDLDQDPDADCHGMGEMWGHIGASSCFMFYWPLADATLCGSFNQVACESATVPFVKAVLQIIRPI